MKSTSDQSALIDCVVHTLFLGTNNSGVVRHNTLIRACFIQTLTRACCAEVAARAALGGGSSKTPGFGVAVKVDGTGTAGSPAEHAQVSDLHYCHNVVICDKKQLQTFIRKAWWNSTRLPDGPEAMHTFARCITIHQ